MFKENEQFLSNHPPSKGTEMSGINAESTVSAIGNMDTMSAISTVTTGPTTVNSASVPVISHNP